MRTIEWDSNKNQLRMIDQRILPHTFEVVTLDTYQAVADAIRTMVVRGAPAIGASAAFGMALAACRSQAKDVAGLRNELVAASEALGASRPTAVNLAWAIKRMMKQTEADFSSTDQLVNRLIAEAQSIADEDVATNQKMAAHGAALIEDGDTIIHHCNTGALATVDWGTALGVIRMAHEMGKRIHVLVDETRPRLQGARLTAWELTQYGIPYDIISDGAAGFYLSRGMAQKVFFGADRVTANGDVANKVGSYMLALAANDNHVPVYSVFPVSTIDFSLQDGKDIPIEERDMDEVLDIQIKGEKVAPAGATARNPAFDVTPHRLMTAWVTEMGVIYPPFNQFFEKTDLEA
jgi:methylthioribose-1-phosphate isomerase